MGHDITAHTHDDDESTAYLRLWCGSKYARSVYADLEASELRGSCSGLGGIKEYTADDIARLHRTCATDEARQFLAAILSHGCAVWINFG